MKPTTSALRARLADRLDCARPRAFARIVQTYTRAHGLDLPMMAMFSPEPVHFIAWPRRHIAEALRILRRLEALS